MATLESSIRMTDRLSRPVAAMTMAMSKLITEMESADSKSIDPKSLNGLRDSLSKASLEVKDLQREIREIDTPIKSNIDGQNNWNRAMNNGKNNMGGIMGKLKTALGMYAGIQGLKMAMDLSDKTAQMDARLNLIVDTPQQKEALKNYIYTQAQDAKAPLQEFGDQVAKVGLLAGDRFKKGNKGIVDYVSTLQKAFRVSGAGAQEASAAMYQLNQALVSGKLQGDEFRSVMENAPVLAQQISKTMGVGMAELKKLGSEGKITSDVIIKSVEDMRNEVEGKYKAMGMTWADVWVTTKNFAIKTMEPILIGINRIVNSERFRKFASEIAVRFQMFGTVAGKVFDNVLKVLGWVYDKWEILKVPIEIITGLVIAYSVAQGIANIAALLQTGAEAKKAAVLMASTGATFAATAAQHGLNAAVYAFPGTWIVAAVMGVIAVVIAVNYAILSFIKYVTGASSIAGAFTASWAMAKAIFYNIMAGIVNAWYTTKSTIISGLNLLISANAKAMSAFANIFIDSFNFIMREATSFMNGLLGKLSKAKPLLEKIGIKIPEKAGNAIQLSRFNLKPNLINDSTKGKNMQYKDIMLEGKMGTVSGDKWAKGIKDKWFGVKDKGVDMSNNMDLGGSGLTNTAKNTGDTAKNTKKMADKLEDTEEEMKYLRELAEQEHINQFTTAEIKIDMKNDNHISKGADLDDLVKELTEKLIGAMKTTANGVYY